MKLSRMFNTLPKRLGASAIIALAFALPALSLAADTVKLEGSLGVANVTAGDTTYKPSVNAKYDQVVKLQVYYHNTENPDSGKIAQNLRVKINIPTAAGKTQTVSSKISADNASNTVNSTATVNLDGSDAYLQYIPGSAVWKHNTGTNDNVTYTETKISDAVVTSGTGLVLENEKPCYNFAATVTVLARVMVPGVKIVKQVEKASETSKWSNNNTANPGDTLKYMITYQNVGNTTQNNVVISDNLPPNMTLVPNTTKIYHSSTPVIDQTNHITSGGLDLGSYTPGAGVSVTFEVKLPAGDKLSCGETAFRNVGVAQPKGMQQYYNIAVTTVNKVCEETPKTPVYSCDAFDVTKGENRTITVSKFNYTAKNGATFKNAVISWGDASTDLTTNTVVGQKHTFAKDGTYTVTATAHFTVNGKDVSDSGNCSKTVSFTTPGTPETPPELPNTGAGQVIGLFGAVAVVSAFAHRLFVSRRQTR